MTNVLIYVIYFDEKSRIEAEKVYGQYEWARPIFNPTTKYIETGFILDVLPTLEDEWRDKDYVGTISWKAHTKCQICVKDLDIALKNNVDLVYFLYGDSNFEGFFEQIDIYHPFFTKIWRLIFNECADSFSENIVPFYCNYWIAKPFIMMEYIKFAIMVRDKIESNTDIKQLVDKNAMWTNPPLTYKNITGKKFYMYHPFIMERLPSFFAYIKNLKISHIKRLIDLPTIKQIARTSNCLVIYVHTGDDERLDAFVNAKRSSDCYYVLNSSTNKILPNSISRSRQGIYEGWSDVIRNIDKTGYEFYVFATDSEIFRLDNWDRILVSGLNSETHFIQFDDKNFIVDNIGLDSIYGKVFHPIIDCHNDIFAMDKTRKAIATAGYYPEYIKFNN